MSRARIVVLSSAHPCRNPRALKEAATLAAAGYDVTLLTLSTRAELAPLDQALLAPARFRPELIPASGRSWLRAQTRFARVLVGATGFELPSALGPASLLLSAARRFPADLVIAHTELALWVATHLAREGRRIAVDLEDWYSEDLLPDARRQRPLRLLRAAERFALREATYVSVPSHSLARALYALHGGRPPVVLRNSFPLQPTPARSLRADPPHFVWFSQTLGPGRGLERFLEAWRRTTRPSELHLIGEARPGYPASLLAALPADRRARVQLHRPVPPPDLPALLARFDLGLGLEETTPPSRDLTITNKVLQYLNAGLGIILTSTSGQRELHAAAPAAGLLLDPARPEATAAVLDDLLGSPARLQAMQQAARAAAEQEFCWEKEAPRLPAVVEEALARTR